MWTSREERGIRHAALLGARTLTKYGVVIKELNHFPSKTMTPTNMQCYYTQGFDL